MPPKNKTFRRDNIPLVSVIIPVYNSAKFISQTLESLLYQTMKNFEVVAVDDCSTDNSVEIVESFSARFGGRLRVVKLKENTGTPGLPRNIGIQYACGKYIYFLDSDDLFTKTALEELSTLAEKYRADVVNLNFRYTLYNDEALPVDDPRMTDFDELTNPKNFKLVPDKVKPNNTVKLESNDLIERLNNWIRWEYKWGIPSLFCKRDFLIKNQIFFPKIRMFEDMSFFFECLCKAEKFLRVPNVTYIVRPRVGSATRGENIFKQEKTFEDYFHVANDGFKEFERIMSTVKFFDNRPDYRYAVLNFFFQKSYVWPWSFQNIYSQIPAFKLNDIVKQGFHADDAPLAAYLFNTFNVYRLRVMNLQREINALKEAERKKSRALINKPFLRDNVPLVSVIIPMYNSAKFIPQTLESLLYQTLKNFEVIVVDDCSTDNTVEVVESFSARFEGRLHVIKLKENTGTPGLPRNVGIQCARGKYIAFLDSDDLFTKTALEELSMLAEEYRADVVRLHRNFILWRGQQKSEDDPLMTNFTELTNPKNFSVQTYKKNLTNAELEPEDLAVRVKRWIKTAVDSSWATWLMFYRRDFLVANQIFFPPMLTCEDAPFAFESLCLAERYLHVPNIVNIIRPRLGSVSRDVKKINFETHMHKRLSAFRDGLAELERIMDKVKFFKEHPNYRYAVLEWFANVRIPVTLGFYSKISAFKLNPFVRREFNSDDAALAAQLFDMMNVYRLNVIKLQKEINALKKSE